MPEPEEYEDLTVADLKDLASEAGLEGYSTLNKAELCNLLAENDVPLPEPEAEEGEDEEPEEDAPEETEDEEPEEEAEEDAEELVEVRIHGAHQDAFEYLDELLDHEIRDYKRYTVTIPKEERDRLLEEIGQPFITPLA